MKILSCVFVIVAVPVVAQESAEYGSGDVAASVHRGLGWLARHQSADGSWSGRYFTLVCQQPCPRVDRAACHDDATGWDHIDIGITGLAVLAFAENGYAHQNGTRSGYENVLRRAVAYLKASQRSSTDRRLDGLFASEECCADDFWIYNHAVATMALARLLKFPTNGPATGARAGAGIRSDRGESSAVACIPRRWPPWR